MSTLSMTKCPRCSGPIEIADDVVFAAGSRATTEREIDICAPCGSDESFPGRTIAPEHWPLADPHVRHREIQDAINAFLSEAG